MEGQAFLLCDGWVLGECLGWGEGRPSTGFLGLGRRAGRGVGSGGWLFSVSWV